MQLALGKKDLEYLSKEIIVKILTAKQLTTMKVNANLREENKELKRRLRSRGAKRLVRKEALNG